jgi:flagellar biosynthesis protein FlhG
MMGMGSCSIVAFVSGKGGVGKTLLSVNLARFLASLRIKTVLIDLDMLNRGATALLQPSVGDNEKTFSRLALSNSQPEELELRQVGEFYFLPSTSTGEIVDWKKLPLDYQQWRKLLLNTLEKIIQKYQPQVIIIDSEVGPHALSIGIAGVADSTIIVSEADPVTWDGTLNYRSYLVEAYGDKKQFFFLLNKVPEKFNFEKLNQYYGEQVSRLLRNLKIISFIPFEYDVSENFGEYKFIVDNLPESVFSSKIKLLAYDLLKERLPEYPRSQLERDRAAIMKRIRPKASRFNRQVQIMGWLLTALGVGAILLSTSYRMLIENPTMTVGLVYGIGGTILIAYGYFRKK